MVGACIALELLYNIFLVRFMPAQSAVWDRMLRYAYWGVFIYLVVGLWPFGREAFNRMKNEVAKDFVPQTEEQAAEVARIREMREQIKKMKEQGYGDYYTEPEGSEDDPWNATTR